MNKPLRRVGIAGALLFLALMININYIQGSEADKLRTDPLNARQYQDRFNHDRGAIMAADATLAASTDTKKKSNRYQRVYKEGEIFSPVTGYQSAFADTGLEAADGPLLDGTDKRLTVHRWFDSFIGKPTKGATVQTTILPKAQRAAFQGVKDRTINRGAAVAIDVKTGAILTMASYPSFDTNSVATHDGKKATAVFNSLTHASGKPLLNKAANETFAPGSSFKTLVAAAAMENGLGSKDSPFDASTLKLASGHTLPNADGDEATCNGTPPLIQSYAHSCNSTFGRLAVQLGQDKLGAMADKFGFNKNFTIEKGMTSATSVYPTRKLDGDDLARSGIGQGDVTATPLQMAEVAEAVANGGKVMKPYLVKRVTAPDTSEIVSADPKPAFQAMSSGTASQLQDMMRQVVTQGTATATLGAGADIAGKTGTAEDGNGKNTNWFVGFAPRDNPKIAFAVVTEGHTGSSGATFSAPIALRMVQAAQ